MAKKKKKAIKPMSSHDRIALHMSLSQQIPALIARCGHLRDQGKLPEARRLLARIEKLTVELTELEG